MIAALRDGVAAFKPQLRDGSGPIERTRTHGVIDPLMARPDDSPSGDRGRAPVPVARGRASIAELGAGETEDDLAPHPWEQASVRRGRSSSSRSTTSSSDERGAELDHTGPIAFFDREVDEYANESDSFMSGDFEAYADMEFASHDSDFLYGSAPLRSPRMMALATLIIATVIAVPFLLAGKNAPEVQTAGAGALAVGGSSPVAGADASSATPTAPPSVQVTNNPSNSSGATGANPATTLATSGTPASATAAAVPAGASADGAPRESELVATPTAATTTVPPTAEPQASEQAETATVVSSTTAPTTVPATTAAPTTTQPVCALHYEAGPGDSWYRIADEAGISPKSLLSANKASVDTVILPGDDICLPPGATKPSPPTTTAPTTTTAAPATTTPPKTTAAPKPVSSTTAAPPATTVPAGSPGRNATPAQVQQIIRDVFPDEAEAKALDVARLESTYSPTAYNGWCCYGIFQIYYSVHAKWLPNFGVNKAEDLYDPLINAKVALEIYRRAGNSFRPWTTA